MANPGFTLAEDAALKNRLSYLTVSDDRTSARPVQVFFRHPDGETEKTYPFITIDLLDISFDPYRQMSEVDYHIAAPDLPAETVAQLPNVIDYYPSEFTAANLAASVPTASYYTTDQFVAVNLIYQVTTHCRSQRHDRLLTMQLLRYVFPMRRGFIEIPEDGTIRRCDLLDWRQSDVLDQETGYKKRIFRKSMTVRINAEIPQSYFETVQSVSTVNGTLSTFDNATPPLRDSITEVF